MGHLQPPVAVDLSAVAEQISERLLILRCQAGDQGAFAELVHRYHNRLGFYLRKMIGNDHTAEDALQDVWLDVVRGLPRLSEPGVFAAWVYRIARRRASRYVSSLRRAPEPLDPTLFANDRPADLFGPDEAGQVHAALGRLAPAHREVLILQFIEGMSGEDIAHVTGCHPGTVRSRVYYAKQELRTELDRETMS